MENKLERRKLGRIDQESTVVIYGAASLGNVTQDQADESIQYALDMGINHFDTAASYGDAELRMGPWMPKIRKDIFLATKTGERQKDPAMRQIEQSLIRLQTDQVDLLQLHAVTSFEELDAVTAKGGALEAAIWAKEQGLVKHIGITGHGHIAPAVHLEALRRFPFETVLTPLNFILYQNLEYRRIFNELVEETTHQNTGLMVIKAVAKGEWAKDEERKYATWYEPFDEQSITDRCVSFVLSHPGITGFASAGDIHLLPGIVEAAKRYRKMNEEEQERLMAVAGEYGSPFGQF
ncbi:aldo/keto reductase [Paenibacillus sp. OV219]|uniref:aldo/keto reductase n=1 Tax=Paenibacillus sp. OV219 TaxID=1884377 RepID=UPI0008CB7498|nr:aldo/keto reductase [Paenibacillus sp. OV219]SEM92868.1 Predicted oxidoreductase [Paenibacillus sp. OV219]